MREEWTSKKAAQDIERQLQGKGLEKPAPKDTSTARPMSPAQVRMTQALTAPLVDDFTAQLERRTNAIEALIAYCAVEEPLITKVVMEPRAQPPPDELRLS